MTLLTVDNITVRYGRLTALRGVSLTYEVTDEIELG